MLKTVGFPSTRTGDQTIVDGNLVIGTAGKGIDFSATPGTGTSELLDDYEEGTWTPNIGGDATYTTQSGTYTKIGNLVCFTGTIIINIRGTGSAISISGLPFSASGEVGTSVYYYVNTSGITDVLALRTNGTSLFGTNSNGTNSMAANPSFITDSTEVRFSGFYFV